MTGRHQKEDHVSPDGEAVREQDNRGREEEHRWRFDGKAADLLRPVALRFGSILNPLADQIGFLLAFD
ncbi:hypothetical protein SLA2020_347980 [Shorea laevis]